MEPEKHTILLSYNDFNIKKHLVIKITTSTIYQDLLQVIRKQFELSDEEMMLSFHTLNGVFMPLHRHNFHDFRRDIRFNKLIRVQRVDPLAANIAIHLGSQSIKQEMTDQSMEKIELPLYSLTPQQTCPFLGDGLHHLSTLLENMGIKEQKKESLNSSRNSNHT